MEGEALSAVWDGMQQSKQCLRTLFPTVQRDESLYGESFGSYTVKADWRILFQLKLFLLVMKLWLQVIITSELI